MSEKLSVKEALFSIKEYDKLHKQLCLCGLKFRIRSKNSIPFNQNFFNNLPIQNNKIIFYTVGGAYQCNPKYIAEEILRQKLPFDVVWCVNKYILKYIDYFPKNLKLVMENTMEADKEFATAKIWVDNERKNNMLLRGFYKRPEQIYIQTFHGSLGIKKSGEERKDVNKIALELSKVDSEQIDYLISNGKYTTDFFKKMFFNNGKILEYGHPRNDIFFKDNTEIKNKIYNELNIPRNKKLVIYAPTLREDRNLSCYTLNYETVIKELSDKFGGEWVLLKRLHPFMVEYIKDFESKTSNVIDVTEYPDIQELLSIADVCITDYSSCIYDFMLTRKPGFIYASDISKYDNERGLYYPLSDTPFPIAQNNDEMVNNIRNFDENKYKPQVDKFLQNKGCIDDGHASERVVNLIKQILLYR